MSELWRLTAAEAGRGIAAGEITSEALVRSCLERIDDRDPEVEAWAHLDPDYAIAGAREADSSPSGGPLHGVPFAVKDVIDSGELPTEYGAPAIHGGHRPDRDATCVAAMRRAGAVLMGKTVSTEFATFQPGKTRNPHNPGHTPGGSSSGSAAAVGASMVPIAFGNQTAGSLIRPAAFLRRRRAQADARDGRPDRHPAARAQLRHARLHGPVGRRCGAVLRHRARRRAGGARRRAGPRAEGRALPHPSLEEGRRGVPRGGRARRRQVRRSRRRGGRNRPARRLRGDPRQPPGYPQCRPHPEPRAAIRR